MDPQSLSWIAAACGAVVDPSVGTALVRRVITDSRLAGPGDLFVALRGENFDGHNFLGEVARRQVTGAMLSAHFHGCIPQGLVVMAVASPRVAFGQLAGFYRQRFQLPMVCVGGSNGKTTTKELVATLLSTRFPTLKSEASFNNDIGVPATLLQLNSRHGAAVLEAGTNHPGELAPLVRMIYPQWGVITNFGREHLEYFGDLDGVVREEGALAEELQPGGKLLLDGDSPFATAVADRRRPEVGLVRVGFAAHNDWRVQDVRQDWAGLTFQVQSSEHPQWTGTWRLPLPGQHSARNATYALAVGAELGVPPDAARDALANFHPPKQRLTVSTGEGLRIMDDTYNANADSMLAALQTLADLPCTGRRVAVLGDMGELGSLTETAHVEVGKATAQTADALFAIGRFAEPTVRAARRAGIPHAEACASVEAALPMLRVYLRPNDTVLVKASRAARLERIVNGLRESFHPPAAAQLATAPA